MFIAAVAKYKERVLKWQGESLPQSQCDNIHGSLSLCVRNWVSLCSWCCVRVLMEQSICGFTLDSKYCSPFLHGCYESTLWISQWILAGWDFSPARADDKFVPVFRRCQIGAQQFAALSAGLWALPGPCYWLESALQASLLPNHVYWWYPIVESQAISLLWRKAKALLAGSGCISCCKNVCRKKLKQARYDMGVEEKMKNKCLNGNMTKLPGEGEASFWWDAFDLSSTAGTSELGAPQCLSVVELGETTTGLLSLLLSSTGHHKL